MITTEILSYLATIALIVHFYYQYGRSTRLLPPGPRKIPLLGNLLDMPRTFEWETFAQWGRDCNSDIIHVKAASVNLIVLNSFAVANELLDKRSTIYSGRPRFTMAAELMGWGWQFSSMGYGNKLRERRTLFQKHFPPSNKRVLNPRIIKFVRILQSRLLADPDQFVTHIRHMLGGAVLSLAYGIDIKPSRDPYVEFAEKAIHILSAATVPGAFLVDSIPLLKHIPDWMPGAGFKRKAREWYKIATEFREMPFSAGEQRIIEGLAQPSFISMCLDDIDTTKDMGYQREVIKDTAGMFFSAGSDTTVSALQTFLLVMTCFPDVQLKAQRELDQLLGKERLPSFSDEPLLPYISAIVKEIIRWQTPAPIGIPHSVDKDDVYNRYHIPAGSLVIANSWAMLHDEKDYPEPFLFNPDRFIKNGKLNPEVRDPAAMAFGFGRRICPGSHIGLSTLWLTAASILFTFNITKVIDDEGNITEPSMKYHSSLITYPLPFECSIKPRSEEAASLIRSAAEEVE